MRKTLDGEKSKKAQYDARESRSDIHVCGSFSIETFLAVDYDGLRLLP
jgi:hypothetical protein